nr:immunoglobulin superfamily member 5 isoform X2 [Nothobranchius furzeri]
MDVCWNFLLSLFIIWTRPYGAVTQELKLEPMNSYVLRDSDVGFRAMVQGSWVIMTWFVKETQVLTVRAPAEVIPSSDLYSARICSTEGPNCVDFTMHNVTRDQAGPVTCNVQGPYKPQTAQLHVQESGTVSIPGGNVTAIQDQLVEFQCVTTSWFPVPSVSWSQNDHAVNSSLYNTSSTAEGEVFTSTSTLKIQAVSNTQVECIATLPALKTPKSSFVFMQIAPKPTDWTVLIAVVVSFGGCALLVLFVVGIIFCYRRRKEKMPIYQNEMKRVTTESQSSPRADEQRNGHVNPSYVPEDHTRVTPNLFLSVQNNLTIGRVMKIQTENMDSNTISTASDSSTVKHRHATIV